MGNAFDAIMNSGKTVGYVRVSTLDQNTDRQLEGIQLDKVFTDKLSGSSSANRPELQAAIEYLREDDTLMIHSMDRLARNVDDLRSIVKKLVDKGVTIVFVKEKLTFSPNGNSIFDQLMLTLLGAFAEFERALSRERQREGIAIAKTKGVYRGRQPSMTPAKLEQLYKMVDEGIPKTKVAKKLKISRSNVYQYLYKRTEGESSGSENQPANT